MKVTAVQVRDQGWDDRAPKRKDDVTVSKYWCVSLKAQKGKTQKNLGHLILLH